ncbi:MAG: PfkB family carbohydrate kinase [Candidatus Taylorbacteria bacterium]
MEKKENKILVVGSVAFDVIFELTSAIREQVSVEGGKAGKQNLMFTAKGKEQFFGGTAGNISYGLGILGAKPLLFSVAGKDFAQDYEKHLRKVGVDVKVKIISEGWTGVYYGMTDTLGEQVGVWQPNAYGEHIGKTHLEATINSDELKEVEVAIFSPGTPESTLMHMKEFRELNKKARMIFDPGQSLMALYHKSQFAQALKIADIFISNDIEILHAKNHFGFALEETLREGKVVIETKGERGSIIFQDGKEPSLIPVFKPKKMVDPTGAGDAYRAGLLFGLSQGLSLRESAISGAKVATRCIEKRGAQGYK